MKKIILLLCLTFLSGCMESNNDLYEFIQSKPDSISKMPAPLEVEKYTPMKYSNTKKVINPFMFRKMRASPLIGEGGPDLERPREVLEDYPIESLKMVGYLLKNNKDYAIIASADGRLFHARQGNYLGINFGEIIEVTPEHIKFKEKIQNQNNTWREQINMLILNNINGK